MRKMFPLVLGLSIAAAGSMCAAAQEAAPPAMPKILQLQREFLKPGKAGMIHDRSEANFVQAMTRAKWPTHYIALNSLSGKSRALYLTAYDSFGAWQKDSDAVTKNAALSAEIDRDAVSDGELLDSFDQAVLYYHDDMSYHPQPDLTHVRYLEVTSFHLHPGHFQDWNDIVKMVIAAHQKAGTHANWGMYEVEYGAGDTYVLLSADTGLDQIDQGFAEDKRFREAMGEDGMKQLDDLAAKTIASSDSELFEINPRQSYPPEEWVKNNPDFWKPKPMSMAAAPPAGATRKPAMAETKPPQ